MSETARTPTVQDPYSFVTPPNISDMQVQLEGLVSQGVLTPEDAQAALAESSKMNGISLDPGLKKAQMDALSGLQDISSGVGLSASDKANLSHINSDEMTQQRGQREAILNNAESRGLGGSGLELMAQLQNQQDSATRQSQKDLDVAGMAQNRALQALQQGGQLAGQIGAQDFGQKAQVAGANDAISKFNAQNQQQVNLTNTGAHNAAQEANLAAKQNIANSNAGLKNTQQQYNKNLIQQDYDNRLKRAGGSAGIATANAGIAGQNAKNAADDINKNIGTGLSAIGMASDERGKKNIKEIDPSDFLDNITGYKFKYKDKKNGEGEKMGIMAQDAMKSDVGSDMVFDTPDGLAINYEKATGPLLASVADLHKRLRKIEGGGDA